MGTYDGKHILDNYGIWTILPDQGCPYLKVGQLQEQLYLHTSAYDETWDAELIFFDSTMNSFVTKCLQCGDKGFSNALVYCLKCLDVAVHGYCLDKLPETFGDFVRWFCEDCKPNLPNQCTFNKHKLQNGPFSLPPEACKNMDLTGHAHLLSDSPSPSIMKLRDFSCSIAKTREQRQSCSSQQRCKPNTNLGLTKHAKLRHGRSPQKTMLSRKTDVACSVVEMVNRQSPSSQQQPCVAHTKPDSPKHDSLVGKCRGTYEEMRIIGKCSNNHGKKVKLGQERRMTLDSRSKIDNKGSQIAINNSSNSLENDCHGRVQPVIDPIWRGSFSILNKNEEILDGFVAHLSNKTCQKVFEEAQPFPSVLCFEMLPKSELWPKSFHKFEPCDDNIALYFFPVDKRHKRVFDHLVDEMSLQELAMRAIVKNAELLVFTSMELPLLYWRFQGKYYLWGVFMSKQACAPACIIGRTGRVRSVCFTFNNPPPGWRLPEKPQIKYAVYQLEVGANGALYMQGVVQFKNSISFHCTKEYVHTSAHLEPCRNLHESVNYCRKEEGRVEGPWEIGELKGQVHQRDRQHVMNAVKEQKTKRELHEEFPELMTKYPRSNKYRASVMSDAASKLAVDANELPWQKKLVQLMENEPDRRTVHWYWSEAGGKGKSKMAAWLSDNMKALVLNAEAAKRCNIYHAYNFERIVCFNISRSRKDIEHIYLIVEELKDGQIFSTNYELTPKKFNPPHVIIFANVPPQEEKMSSDRWHIVNVD
ncbi:unnamed protein product [Ilex paraguariensis]|uniref:CRESS-DNA virus Rep endonuclease domain-containing protein n=1 Tax=Ilex paraguariensis TaxID=185542 RepID=A0ABC8QTM9_9AQUA